MPHNKINEPKWPVQDPKIRTDRINDLEEKYLRYNQ